MCLNKIYNKYDTLIAGDLNIDKLDPIKNISNHLSDITDVFDLTNLVKETTCFKSE